MKELEETDPPPQHAQPSGLLLGKAGRNIDEQGSGFMFRFNGVTRNIVQLLKKEWNGTKHKQMRLLLNGKRLWQKHCSGINCHRALTHAGWRNLTSANQTGRHGEGQERGPL